MGNIQCNKSSVEQKTHITPEYRLKIKENGKKREKGDLEIQRELRAVEYIVFNPLTHFVQNGQKVQYIVAISLKGHIFRLYNVRFQHGNPVKMR